MSRDDEGADYRPWIMSRPRSTWQQFCKSIFSSIICVLVLTKADWPASAHDVEPVSSEELYMCYDKAKKSQGYFLAEGHWDA